MGNKKVNPTEAEKAFKKWDDEQQEKLPVGYEANWGFKDIEEAFSAGYQAGRESMEHELRFLKEAYEGLKKHKDAIFEKNEALKKRIAELENKKIFPQPSFDAVCRMDAEQEKQAMKPRTIKELEEDHEERQAIFNKNMRRALAKKKEVGEG